MTEPEASVETWTIGRILAWSADFLRSKGQHDSPKLDAELLLGHALKLARIQLYTQFDKPLSAAEREPFKAFLQRRSRGEPVAYILGEKDFMGYRFAVTKDVLIPRPDTETLVEYVLERAKAGTLLLQDGVLPLLDVGTGSGCIAISLALKLHRLQTAARCEGWDNSPEALAVARVNADTLGAAVAFHRRDALLPASWAPPPLVPSPCSWPILPTLLLKKSRTCPSRSPALNHMLRCLHHPMG